MQLELHRGILLVEFAPIPIGPIEGRLQLFALQGIKNWVQFSEWILLVGGKIEAGIADQLLGNFHHSLAQEVLNDCLIKYAWFLWVIKERIIGHRGEIRNEVLVNWFSDFGNCSMQIPVLGGYLTDHVADLLNLAIDDWPLDLRNFQLIRGCN